jgi:hypothetical protein
MSHTPTPDLPSVEPCPFCGSGEPEVLHPHSSDGWWVRCEGCHVQTTEYVNRESAITAWNRRAQRMEAAAQEVPSGLQALLAEAREAIEPLTGAQIRLHRIKRDLADRIDAALSASPAAALEKPDSEVAEALIAACVPGGDTCDPQRVADAIREWFASRGTPAAASGDSAGKLRALAHEIRSYVKADWRASLELMTEWADAIDAALSSTSSSSGAAPSERKNNG